MFHEIGRRIYLYNFKLYLWLKTYCAPLLWTSSIPWGVPAVPATIIPGHGKKCLHKILICRLEEKTTMGFGHLTRSQSNSSASSMNQNTITRFGFAPRDTKDLRLSNDHRKVDKKNFVLDEQSTISCEIWYTKSCALGKREAIGQFENRMGFTSTVLGVRSTCSREKHSISNLFIWKGIYQLQNWEPM